MRVWASTPNGDQHSQTAAGKKHPDSVRFRPLHSSPFHGCDGTAPIGWPFLFVPFRHLKPTETGLHPRETAGFQFPLARRRLETRLTRAPSGLPGDCGKLPRPGKSAEARPRQFSADSGEGFQPGGMSGCLSSPFYARHHPTACCSLVRHRADSWERDQKPRQRLPSDFPPLSRF